MKLRQLFAMHVSVNVLHLNLFSYISQACKDLTILKNVNGIILFEFFFVQLFCICFFLIFYFVLFVLLSCLSIIDR